MRRRFLFPTAAAAATVALSGVPAFAQQNPVTVTGVITCSHAGPVGRQAVTWTVTNGTGSSLTINGNGTETGTLDGNPIGPTGLEVTPNPIGSTAPNNTGTAGDGPFGGTSTGTLTFVVSWTSGNESEGTSTGNVTVPGGCVNVEPTTTSTSTTTTIRTTTTAVAVTSTPKFTG